MLLCSLAYGAGFRKSERLYFAGLADIKASYEADIEARELFHRRFSLYYYFGGVIVGVLALWLWLRWRK